MEEMDFNEDEYVSKIPYDKEPILRASGYDSRSNLKNGGARVGKGLYILIGLLFAINIVMGGLFLKFTIFDNKARVVNNPTYNITVDGTNTAWAAANKAKLSAVCVSAGYTSASGSSIDYQRFFNMASRGSGVITDINKETGEATIVTCYHVVENNTKEIYILAYDSYEPIKASLVNYSSNYDIAVLKVGSNSVLPVSSCDKAEIANSSMLVEGQMAIAVGNPLAMGFSVSCGVVSSPLNLVNIEGVTTRVVKIDTPINSGNSGGGLFNSKGELIGIVNAKIMSSDVDNVAYAIPSNTAMGLATSILRNGSSKRPQMASIGLTAGSNLKILSSGNSVEGVSGQLKHSIVVDGIVTGVSYTAGIQAGDILVSLSFNGITRPVVGLFDLEDALFCLGSGDELTIRVNRSGVEKDITVKVNYTTSVL